MKRDAAPHFLDGGGELGALMRARDWSASALGPVETWPQSLRSAVSILLPSKAQIALFWGPELITLYNDAYRPVFGQKHPRALGQPIRESWSELWRDGLKELFERVLETGEAYWAKDRPFFMERHGYLEETFFDVSYDPVRDESGAVGGVFCIVSETTGRVVGERRLKVLRDMAAASADAGSVVEVCVRSMRVLEQNPADVPFALAYLFDGKDPQLVASAGVAADDRPGEWPLADKVQLHDLQARFSRVPAGPWPERPPSAMVLPLVDRGEQRAGAALVLGVSARTAFDEAYRGFFELVGGQLSASIAAARASEEQRRRAEALAEIDRAKTAFFSNVSHEFRTPLTLMLGPVEDALADAAAPLPPAQRERLELARRNALRLQKLVNTLLEFSRIEAGRVQASFEPADLGPLTAELASSFRSAMEKAGLTLTVDCAPLGEPVYVDREMWEKVVLNLLSNAFKFTFEGGVSVSVRRAGAGAELAVRDTGTGIPAHELPHVFERFRRVEGARSRTHEGTGIGLALVQELVRLHGGTLRVESAVGKGSAFFVTLPFGSAHLPAERIGAPRTLASTALGAQPFLEEALGWLPDAPALGGRAPQSRPRVVWADDNADMRDYVRHLLSAQYEVEACADGRAALEAARRARPDLVLADVMMPGLDGFGLLRALRADEALRDVPVLLLSARAGEEARIEGLEQGADDYLVKPFSARELLVRVDALLKSSIMRRDVLQALRESEQRLRAIVETTPECVKVVAADGTLVQMNPSGLAMIGAQCAEDAIGRCIYDLVAPEHRELFRGFNEKVCNGERGRLEFEVIALDGSRRHMETHAAPLRQADGSLAQLAVTRDVTERKQADRRKDEFIATLSHELRNPLAPLRNGLDVLRLAGVGEGQAATALGIMERQVSHLARLVDDLLEMSRITRGAFELRRERLAISAVVAHAVEISEPAVRAGHHRLELSLPGEPLWVEGDAVRLAQILANLLDNAAKYTPAGGLITVMARRADEAVEVSVSDNGEGISAEALPRLFEMFSRGDRTSGRRQSGLGIGLALARRLAEMHGGTLEARSGGVGAGAEFVLRLPAARGEAPHPAAEAAGEARLPPRRVLVVDDNRDAAESLAAVLQMLGAEVRLAHSGPEALAQADAYQPSVVLLDIGMPGMDGYEVARRLRARQDPAPMAIVALTGWGQVEDRRRTVEAGFDHHLVKPAELPALQSLLASLQ